MADLFFALKAAMSGSPAIVAIFAFRGNGFRPSPRHAGCRIARRA